MDVRHGLFAGRHVDAADQHLDVVYCGQRTEYDLMYAKLFGSIISSSLWTEDNPTRITFITMLAMADRDGYIYASSKGLARMACLEHGDVEMALDRLSEPDLDSSDRLRNPDNEGRRIEEIPGGWMIINYLHYRGIRDADDRKLQNREAQRRWREKQKRDATGQTVTDRDSKPESATANENKPISDHYSEADQSQSQEKKRKKIIFVKPTLEEISAFLAEKGITNVDPVKFYANYESKTDDEGHWMVGKRKMTNWKMAVWTWVKGE